jgi:hypothetical protein
MYIILLCEFIKPRLWHLGSLKFLHGIFSSLKDGRILTESPSVLSCSGISTHYITSYVILLCDWKCNSQKRTTSYSFGMFLHGIFSGAKGALNFRLRHTQSRIECLSHANFSSHVHHEIAATIHGSVRYDKRRKRHGLPHIWVLWSSYISLRAHAAQSFFKFIFTMCFKQ